MSDASRTSAAVPRFLVGASLYPTDSEAMTPEQWYERDLNSDLDALATVGGGIVRLFVSWRVLEPQVGRYDDEMLDRLAALVSDAGRRKMRALVCLFADDRAAELNTVTWGTRRDPRTDPYLVQRGADLATRVAGRLAREGALLGWQLGNEAFLSGFDSYEELEEWFDAIHGAIAEVDRTHPVALGAHAESLLLSTGIDARPLIERCGLHLSHATSAYRAYAAGGPLGSGPSTYLDSFLARLARTDAPVLVDEVGVDVQSHSVAEQAAHVRTTLWGALANRAAGALVRRMRDMETDRREPYFIDPFETLVGVADNDGLAKPALLEIAEFTKTLAKLDLREYAAAPERAAIVMPADRYEPLPAVSGLFAPRACFQSFITAKRAHVPVSVVHEGDDLSSYLLLIVPSAMSLAEQTWSRLAEFVNGGGTLLLSHGGGDAHPAIREIFGVEPLGDDGPRETFSCRVAQPDALGALRSFDASLPLPNYALLSSSGASVVATDAVGNPLLTVNQSGQGRAVYIATPLERAIAQGDPWATPRAVVDFATQVYEAVAGSTGCSAPISCDAPDVEIAVFQGDTNDVVVLINHASKPLTATLSASCAVSSVQPLRGGSAVAVGGASFGVPLGPSAVSVLRVEYA